MGRLYSWSSASLSSPCSSFWTQDITDIASLYWRSLGVEESKIEKLVLKQLGVWFGLPVTAAIVVAVVVISYFMQTISVEISAYIGFPALLSQMGLTVGILVLLLILLFYQYMDTLSALCPLRNRKQLTLPYSFVVLYIIST